MCLGRWDTGIYLYSEGVCVFGGWEIYIYTQRECVCVFGGWEIFFTFNMLLIFGMQLQQFPSLC